ncbi:MAG TPA: hypothetical protein PK093_12645 [Phycisphaerae bacterium]|nr:hypothetical protein [Phycisphaerae bacterium]
MPDLAQLFGDPAALDLVGDLRDPLCGFAVSIVVRRHGQLQQATGFGFEIPVLRKRPHVVNHAGLDLLLGRREVSEALHPLYEITEDLVTAVFGIHPHGCRNILCPYGASNPLDDRLRLHHESAGHLRDELGIFEEDRRLAKRLAIAFDGSI